MLITATITFFILMLSVVAAITYRMWDREGLPAPSGETAEPSPPPAGRTLPRSGRRSAWQADRYRKGDAGFRREP